MISRTLTKLLLVASDRLPVAAVRWLAETVAPWTLWIPAARRGLDANARHILPATATPSQRRELSRAVLRNFGRALADLALAHRLEDDGASLPLRVEGGERFERAAPPGRGFVAVTLHMGSYEVGCRVLAEKYGEIAIVYHRDPTRLFETLRSRQRRRYAVTEIAVDRSPYFGIEILERLRRGGGVLMAGELAAGPHGEPFDFLDGQAHFSPWPARLAITAGVPLLPSFILRDDDGGFSLYLDEPIEPGPDDRPREVMQRLVRVFERYVRRFPDQWLMVRPFWQS